MEGGGAHPPGPVCHTGGPATLAVPPPARWWGALPAGRWAAQACAAFTLELSVPCTSLGLERARGWVHYASCSL
eukprot:COSAG01_NODE_565_length_15436_cov_64.116581_22_plen_74_part_00